MHSNLRPRAASEIVDAAVQLFKRHARSLFVTAGIMVIPLWLTTLMFSLYMPVMDTTGSTDLPPAGVAWAIIAMVVAMVWAPIGFGALVYSASGAYLTDEPAEPLPAYRLAISRTIRLIVANLLGGIILLLVTALAVAAIAVPIATLAVLGFEAPILVGIVGLVGVCLVSWVYCVEFGRLLLITPLVMLEERTIMGALRRARVISRGFANRTGGLIFVGMILYVVFALGLVVMSEVMVGGTVLMNSVQSLLFLVLYPIVACLMVVLYYDLKVRKEGLDMELLAGQESLEIG